MVFGGLVVTKDPKLSLLMKRVTKDPGVEVFVLFFPLVRSMLLPPYVPMRFYLWNENVCLYIRFAYFGLSCLFYDKDIYYYLIFGTL